LKNLDQSFHSILKGTNTKKNLLRDLLTIAQRYFKLFGDIQGTYSLQAIFSKWNDNLLYETFIQIISIEETYEVKSNMRKIKHI